MCKKTNALLLLTMAFIMFGLLSALLPVSDFDQDGHLDSLVTEGFLLIPMLCSVSSLFFLWIRTPRSLPPHSSTFFYPDRSPAHPN